MALKVITADNFKDEVLDSTTPVLLDFWASWCGPCQMLSPIVDEIAEENKSITVGKVNVDEQPALAEAFSIVSIPTLIVIKDGKTTSQMVGVRPKEAILAMINE